jgi:hypothetical protein
VTPPGPVYMSNEQFGMFTSSIRLSILQPSNGHIRGRFLIAQLISLIFAHDNSNIPAADYLADLRNNRVSRPSGARPQPSSGRRESDRGVTTTVTTDEPPDTPSADTAPRPTSALSHRRAQSSLSTYSSVTSRTSRPLVQQPYPGIAAQDHSQVTPAAPLRPSDVVPTATYIERGQRWMEKEEAVSLRTAMEDMDLKKQVCIFSNSYSIFGPL